MQRVGGGSKLTTPLPFHCGFSNDYREVIADLKQRMPQSPLLGLSFSLGANIMAKYIGEEGMDCLLTAGIIVGNPYDMYKVISHLDSRSLSPNKIYDVAILNFLKTAFKENQAAILSAPVKFDLAKISNSSTIMEFTEEMTRKAFGYTSAKHLLDDSSSLDHLDKIRIPVLFLNALDDPICIPSLIPFDKFLRNPWLLLALTRHGGHIGYMANTWPTSWIERPVTQFFECILKSTASEKPDLAGAPPMCPTLCDPARAYYVPSWVMPSGDMQTIYLHTQNLKPAGCPVRYEREIFEFSDGGQAAVDWAQPRQDTVAGSPLIVLVPGIAGGSHDFYVRSFIHHIGQAPYGYQVVVLHSRGCNGVDLHTPKAFHAGMTEDLREFVKRLAERWPESPLIGIGFSLGANILTKYIGEESHACRFVAAASVCNPFDIDTTVGAMCLPTIKNRFLYAAVLTRSLISVFTANQKVILAGEVVLDAQRILSSRNINEFNEEYTAKVFGFQSAKELNVGGSCVHHLKDVRVPMLFINALDDPMCYRRTIPFNEIAKNPSLVLACTRYGGHLAYFEGASVTPWLPKQLLLFVRAMLEWK
ncbi:medium-chain fatty acid ethyl ester synthase/esterase 2 [Coemansia sp. BCRC 34301]|nr:medium-chain fatty acid ethyl ester synthase/esterase 2 [Coemansia sp. BCRC 34301]